METHVQKTSEFHIRLALNGSPILPLTEGGGRDFQLLGALRDGKFPPQPEIPDSRTDFFHMRSAPTLLEGFARSRE